ncbi:MAG TPA: hypothetical protein VF172_03930 [Nitrososphaera sp.]
MKVSPDMRSTTTLIYIMAGIVAVLAIGVAYLWSYIPATESNAEASDRDENDSAGLTLISVNAYEYPNHVLRGAIESGQSFKVHEPVFLQANFSNPNSFPSEHLVVSQINGPEGSNETKVLSMVRVEAAESGYVSVDLYWEPKQTGEYRLMVWTTASEDLRETPPTLPAASIPLIVID